MKRTNIVVRGNFKNPQDQLEKCAAAIEQILKTYGCEMFTALKVGNAETPLVEVGGFPVVVKLHAPKTLS